MVRTDSTIVEYVGYVVPIQEKITKKEDKRKDITSSLDAKISELEEQRTELARPINVEIGKLRDEQKRYEKLIHGRLDALAEKNPNTEYGISERAAGETGLFLEINHTGTSYLTITDRIIDMLQENNQTLAIAAQEIKENLKGYNTRVLDYGRTSGEV